MKTDTPRTDKHQKELLNHSPICKYDSMASHARQLERELAEARRQRDRLADALRKLDDLGPPSKARSIIYEALASIKQLPPVE